MWHTLSYVSCFNDMACHVNATSSSSSSSILFLPASKTSENLAIPETSTSLALSPSFKNPQFNGSNPILHPLWPSSLTSSSDRPSSFPTVWVFPESRFKNQILNDPYANYQSLYSQMLCGLCHNDLVLRVGAVFAFGFIRAIRFLEKHCSLLSHNIRTSTLNPTITDPSVREAVMRILKPDPSLSSALCTLPVNATLDIGVARERKD